MIRSPAWAAAAVAAVGGPALVRRLGRRLKIDPDQARLLLDAGATTVLDVRTGWEWTRGHIPGARRASVRQPDPGDPDATVLTVCSHGGRSLLAARRLRQRGIRAYSLAGGMRAWRRAGLPTVTPG